MIGALSSGNPKEDYILECLWDVGLRSFTAISDNLDKYPDCKLLLVTKEELTDSEIESVLDFLNGSGDVLVLCPCSGLFDAFGGWSSTEGSSGLTANDSFSTRSAEIPIFEPIHSTDGGEITSHTDDKHLPVLVAFEPKNVIQFFSFSVSRNIFKIRQGCYGEGYTSNREKLGGFAHKYMNPLELTGLPVHEDPYADLLTYLVLETILTLLARREIHLPFLWTIPNLKDACILMTMDEDWASPVVTEDALRLFLNYEMPLTLFLTTSFDRHPGLHMDDLVEYSVHPFHKGDVFSQQTLQEAISFLPRPPSGFRNHRRLVEKPEMYEVADELGLQWNSNLGVSNSSGYSLGTGLPFKIFHDERTDVLEFPIHFEDDVHFTTCPELGFDGTHITRVLEKAMDSMHSYFVLGFHPIHVFLNSSSAVEYENAKKEGILEKNSRLLSFREPLLGKEGTRKLLQRILEFINSHRSRLHADTLGRINDFWRRRAEIKIEYENGDFRISPVFEGLGIAFPFLEDGVVKENLGVDATREVDVSGIPSILVETPSEGIKTGLWKVPNIKHANP